MSEDREQELQDTILRQSNEIAALRRRVAGLERDLEHATGDVVSKMAANVSRCRRILDAFNTKMRLVDDGGEEGQHGRQDRHP